jgi:hypothetical protein
MTREEFESRMKKEEEERKERKSRELNVIVHGIDECGEETQGGEERMKWDMQQCSELFGIMELGIAASEIKFCRRVGTKGESSRPLVVGLYNERTRMRILKADWKTVEPEVRVGPDMTKKQREEEAQVWKDLEEKNSKRTEDEMAKNLEWRVVGQKGERRLVLGQARGQKRGRGWTRGQERGRGWTGGQVRGRGGTRGAGSANYTRRGAQIWRGRQLRGAWRGAEQQRGAGRPTGLLPPPPQQTGGWRPGRGEEDEEEEEIIMDNIQQNNSRTRIGSKRKEREDETAQEEMDEGTAEPPAKH